MSDYVKSKDAKSDIKVSRGKKKQLNATQTEIKKIIQLSKDCLHQFSKIIDMKIHFLWPEHKIDEAFINLLSNTCFDVLENKNFIKEENIKHYIFDILQKCMKNYGKEMKYMMNRNTQKIIHLLYYQDDVAKPIAEFVGLVCQKQDNSLATELIKELTEGIFASDSDPI